jgi:DNA invertase Pin-like site-specific DNA recombinase
VIVGYARTVSAGQHGDLAAQVGDLTAAGAETVYSEQVSAVDSRLELQEALRYVRKGDVLMVTTPDRLARSTAVFLTIKADLEKCGVALVVLSLGGQRLDTRNPTSEIMLTVLGGVAAWEREIMQERRHDAIAKAKAEGRYKSRTPNALAMAAEILRLAEGGCRRDKIAEQLGIGVASVYRILAQHRLPH